MRKMILFLGVSLSLAAGLARAGATYIRIHDSVKIDVIQNAFHNEQDWLVYGATPAELSEAAHHLTLTGRYGVFGDRQLLKTDVPEELQNYGDGVRAWAHPALVPNMFGARAGTVPTANGFQASMSGGMLGRGLSDVTFTRVDASTVKVSERGTWTLAEVTTGAKIVDIPFRLGLATFGRVPLVLAHKTMGALHNRMFNAPEALVNWVNDHRRK